MSKAEFTRRLVFFATLPVSLVICCLWVIANNIYDEIFPE